MNHTVKVTPKMKRFFWYMFYKSKDVMWRRLALTKKTEFRIISPPRPFLVFQKEDVDNIKAELWKMIDQNFRQA
jgi:hypothetical protein